MPENQFLGSSPEVLKLKLNSAGPTIYPKREFWMLLWASWLAVGWLLPNHYAPWWNFYNDAWIALTFSVTAIFIFWKMHDALELYSVTVIVAIATPFIWIQYYIGLIPLVGNVWISTLYMLGFFMALLTGALWEKSKPGELPNLLFLAIGIAAVVSVGLQLQQWLQLQGMSLWTMGGYWTRPHANFGQPNQLATFLLWGVLSSAWGYSKKMVSGVIATLLAAFLIFGVALTASRTAWIGVTLLVFAACYWRDFWPSKYFIWVVIGLGVFFGVAFATVGRIGVNLRDEIGWVDEIISNELLSDASARERISAWSMFFDAAWRQPFGGYGWNQTTLAQVEVSLEHSARHQVFSFAHNLFIDLILWCGIPIGIFLIVTILSWFWRCFQAVRNAEVAILFSFLIVVANHAMLELPLYYAYILVPVGFVIGVLNYQIFKPLDWMLSRTSTITLWTASALMLIVIIKDYALIEPSYKNMEFEQIKLKVERVESPDVLLLTQWKEYINFARFTPVANMNSLDIIKMTNIASLYPGSLFLHKIATIDAINNRPIEAGMWLKKLCKLNPESQCLDAQKIWTKQALEFPEIAAISWPILDKD
jgi:O-antigen ligase